MLTPFTGKVGIIICVDFMQNISVCVRFSFAAFGFGFRNFVEIIFFVLLGDCLLLA